MTTSSAVKTQVCIAGGGPAGMMLGYLLARAGVHVIVLEKHGDFLRDFRGDTVHPSTLTVLRDCALLAQFEKLPQQRAQHLALRAGKRLQPVVDFRGLGPFDYLALVPQWDFLDLLASEANQLRHFSLRMNHEVSEFLVRDNRACGVRLRSGEEIEAELVVACDGRDSVLRQQAALPMVNLGAPMDALWFKLPRHAQHDPGDVFAILGAGKMMVLLNRGSYWQAAMVVPKGTDRELRAQPISQFQQQVTALAPFLRDAFSNSTHPHLSSWEEVKTLVVEVNRLQQWCLPGLLFIGDAAHAMSPIGGVGINLAIQDAVAAAKVITQAFRNGFPLDKATLNKVQKRRELPTRLTQMAQLQIQKRVVTPTLKSRDQAPNVPPLLRFVLRSRLIRNIPARLIGYGFRQERVDKSLFVQ